MDTRARDAKILAASLPDPQTERHTQPNLSSGALRLGNLRGRVELPLPTNTNNTKPALNNPIPQDAMGGKSATKSQYFDKLKGLLEEYRSIFIVGVDNVSSQQMHEIRLAMRGKGVILMGKNTMVRGRYLPRDGVYNG